MNALKEWWNQASSKDQTYLLVMSISVALYLLYMGVYKPVNGMLEKQLERNRAQLASLERVKDMAAQVKADKSPKTEGRGPSIDSIVQSSLSANGLRASSMDVSGNNTVRVRLDDAKFEDFLAWLYDLEIAQGMRVKDISVAGGGDAGTVSVNLRLQKGS